jgi:hypothetical protein
MLRKALVSDIVRSFVYCVRFRGYTTKLLIAFPFPVLAERRSPSHVESQYAGYSPAVLTPFAIFAYQNALTHGHAGNYMTMLAAWFADMSKEEHDYAVYLMTTYHMKDANVCTR